MRPVVDKNDPTPAEVALIAAALLGEPETKDEDEAIRLALRLVKKAKTALDQPKNLLDGFDFPAASPATAARLKGLKEETHPSVEELRIELLNEIPSNRLHAYARIGKGRGTRLQIAIKRAGQAREEQKREAIANGHESDLPRIESEHDGLVAALSWLNDSKNKKLDNGEHLQILFSWRKRMVSAQARSAKQRQSKGRAKGQKKFKK